MADFTDKKQKRIDNSLSTWQSFKAGWAGDASAQLKQKEQYLNENEQAAQAEALKRRRTGK